MMRLLRTCAFGCVASVFALPAVAQNASLDRLLEEVRRGQSQAAELNAEREQRFLRNKQEQQQLLEEARRELANIRRRTNQQKAEFDRDAQAIASMKQQLAEQTGDLEQLFGQIRTAAGDARAQMGASLTAAQFPERTEFLANLANGNRPIQLRQLELLWTAYQQEITEAGKVVSFDTQIIDESGSRRPATVTRVGVFTAVEGETYLDYLQDTQQIQALPSQPGRVQREIAGEFAAAAPGTHPQMIVDPTRGGLLRILVDRPSLKERIAQGKLVGYVILSLGALGVVLALFQALYLLVIGAKVRKQKKQLSTPRTSNPLGRLLKLLDDALARGDTDLEAIELRLDEGVLREIPKLERSQGMIKLLAAVAPMLGLLGTVIGMIATFQAIALAGTGDPRLMADGISQALTTTVLGLVVAIPLLFIHSLLASRSKSLMRVLEEQTAGMIARRLESGQVTQQAV